MATKKLGAQYDFLQRWGTPVGWREAQLGDLADIVGGGTPARDESRYWTNGSIPWATPTDITSNDGKYISSTAENITPAGLASSAAHLLPAQSVLLTSRATIGAKALATVPMATNQGFANLVPREVRGEYLYYLLDMLITPLKRLGSGTTFLEVSKRDVRRVWCAVPRSEEEQAAIVRILTAADVAVAAAHRAAKAARALADSVMADLLSNGVDEAGRVRDTQRCPDEFTTTNLGRLPRSWCVSTVGAEFGIQSGITLNESRRGWHRKHSYLRVADVRRNDLDLAEILAVGAPDSEIEARTLEVGDLLIVEGHADRMQIGRCALATSTVAGMTFQNHLFRLRSNSRLVPEFACLWLNSAFAQRYWNARCGTSSGLNTINQQMLRKLPIPVPSDDEQCAIAKIAHTQRVHLDSLRLTMHSLVELKDSVMQTLLSGRLDLLTNRERGR